MVRKAALLVGVSEYGQGLNALPGAVKDVDAIYEVLVHPEMGGFAETDVRVLKNPQPQEMTEELYWLFRDRKKDDLLLFYFSGHGIKDEYNNLYLATRITRKENGNLYEPSAIAATALHTHINRSQSQRQVVILDCCFSGAIAQGMTVKDDGAVNLNDYLGGKGRAILTSSTSTEYSFSSDTQKLTEPGLSIYTRYLVEGIKTGAANTNNDEMISVEELHDYASRRVKEAAPAMTPKFYPVEEGYRIALVRSRKDDPKLTYRRELQTWAEQEHGKFTTIVRSLLKRKQNDLGILPEEAQAIEDEVLQPYRDYERKLKEYEEILIQSAQTDDLFSPSAIAARKEYQRCLGLRDSDISDIEKRILEPLKLEPQQQVPSHTQEEEHDNKSRQYEDEFSRAVQMKYSLSSVAIDEFRRSQQKLGLTVGEATEIEAKVLNAHQEKLANLQQDKKTLLPKADYKHLPNEEAHQDSYISQQKHELSNQDIPHPHHQRYEPTGQAPADISPQEAKNEPKEIQQQSFAFDVITVNTKGAEINRTQKTAEFFVEDLGNSILLEMVKVPDGTFQMGSLKDQGNSTEKPQHSVRVPAFFMGKFPVTQAQWHIVTGLPRVNIHLDPDPANFKGDNRPTEQISWFEAVEFCDRLSQKTGRIYRLPTEAEWEYACRAGTSTPFHFGEVLPKGFTNCNIGNIVTFYTKAFSSSTTNVGSFNFANDFGLYDMHGNVWEWCIDHWHDNYQDAPSNGQAWISKDEGQSRVLRGGSWDYPPRDCRSASRIRYAPTFRLNVIGFRVVTNLPE